MRRKKASVPSARKGRSQKTKTKDSASIDLRRSNRVFKPHAIALTFPPLSGEELQELVRDIAEHGQCEPITLYEDEILDGWHRYQACREIGVTPFYREFKGDVKDAGAYARSANAIRRHLTTEQRHAAAEHLRKLIADLLKVDASKSDRQIAAQAGSTHPTVARVRAELEQSGDVERVPHREDTKGRQQPAHKPTIAEQRAAVSREEQRAYLGDEKFAEQESRRRQEAEAGRVDEFIDEALEFIADYDNRLSTWLEHATLKPEAKAELVHSLQQVGRQFTLLAQSVDAGNAEESGYPADTAERSAL